MEKEIINRVRGIGMLPGRMGMGRLLYDLVNTLDDECWLL